MTDERRLRIALLIDADNAPPDKIDEILTELSTLGEINVRRAYGNWTKFALSGWQDKLLKFAIRPMQQFDYSKGKNATDMALTVDAMELLYTDHPDAFGIVSSDADFTPLVMHLRAKGAAVFGFGASQTPRPFVSACSRFLYLESFGSAVPPTVIEANSDGGAVPALAASAEPERAGIETVSPGVPAKPASLKVPGPELRKDAGLMTLLRDAAKAARDEAGWATVHAMGQQIRNKTPFDSRNYGHATLSKLLKATEVFEFQNEGTSYVAVKAKQTRT